VVLHAETVGLTRSRTPLCRDEAPSPSRSPLAQRAAALLAAKEARIQEENEAFRLKTQVSACSLHVRQQLPPRPIPKTISSIEIISFEIIFTS
jgi:hypothetical protein